ncbi:MAG: adenosylcobinamide-phosphate synthase CbiB [Desulfobulbaceae bacterium]|nr:adenosylcobinamide-phosphate synthase CbiB [Desulfobulbaceae bacterium]
MSFEVQILLALLMDALIGDPSWLPHPVRMIGWLAEQTENVCRKIVPSERTAGICTVILVLTATGTSGWLCIRLADTIHPLAGDSVTVLILYTCFAARDLIGHSQKVADALLYNDLNGARKMVGRIVGRDTAELEREGVVRACVESVAENTVDGVTAPLFWAVIGGPIGALLYKAVNTMDSIFGYTNERYRFFGWAPARLDDLLNWLPARITGLMMVTATLFLGMQPTAAWRIFRRDRLNHSSPNSGHTEAAIAGALGISLGGTSKYSGKNVSKPVIGDDCYPPDTVHIEKANVLMVATTALMALFLLGARMVLIG